MRSAASGPRAWIAPRPARWHAIITHENLLEQRGADGLGFAGMQRAEAGRGGMPLSYMITSSCDRPGRSKTAASATGRVPSHGIGSPLAAGPVPGTDRGPPSIRSGPGILLPLGVGQARQAELLDQLQVFLDQGQRVTGGLSRLLR